MMASAALAALAFLGASIGLDTLSPQELGLAELRRLGVSSREGIVATHVYSMSPADRAGLREGDVLLQLDGVALGTRDEMSAVLERHHPQDRVSLEYVRGSRRQAVEIVLESPAEMFVRACDARDPEGCYAAGNRFRYGRVVPRDSPKATRYYEQGCSLDQWASCINLGRMLRDAEGVPRDAARAVGLFQRACDAGVPEGCHHLGLQYLKGSGVSPDEARGQSLIRSACEAGDADACGGLRQRPPTPSAPPPAARSGEGSSCQGSYSLGDGRFSFSRSVASAAQCADAAAEHARTICRINRLGAGAVARGQWSFREGTTSAIKGFTIGCP